MAEATISPGGRSYLAELETALAGLPADVRGEIVAGITEELRGLDSGEAATRIRELGDPEFIAAEARAEAGVSAGMADEAPAHPVVAPAEPRWYPVLAALLVAFGGVVVPVIGWVVGIAMVWMSKSWRLWEKWVGTLIAPGAAVLAAGIPFIIAAFEASPSAGESPNPLFPTYYDPFATLIFGPVLFSVVAGIWLLWRAKRVWSAGERVSPSHAAQSPEPTTGPRWFAILTVLLLIIGGYVLPVLGWVLGVVMLWATDAWSRREKWVGTLVGPAAMVAGMVIVLVVALIVRAGAAGMGGLAGWHFVLLGGLVLPLVANLVVGIWLMRRAR